jgi:ABC-type nitrate/sulfonate/bicarbonate transport system substrate-binding protein
MDKITQIEYNKELLNIYKKFCNAVTKGTEFCADATRKEAAEVILDEIFEDINISSFRKVLKSNIQIFFNKNMTVKQVEDLLNNK